jgi:hypothetical protein
VIDVAMFDQLARPCGGGIVQAGKRLITLEDVFGLTVANGWCPRSPAFEPELSRLEVSTTRGNCLEPLIFAGDVVYIDRNAKPLPGDLVSLKLSKRYVADNNGSLVNGQPPREGDQWLKLFVLYHGFEMLLENRDSATATRLACEHPDDTPVLHPIRQVRRDGRLLFTPDSHAGQLGDNAASQMISAQANSSIQTLNVNASNSPVNSDLQTVTITTSGFPVAIDLSVNWDVGTSAAGVVTSFALYCYRDGSNTGSAGYVTNGAPAVGPSSLATLSVTDMPSAGTHTYTLRMVASGTGSGTGTPAPTGVVNYWSAFVKAREIKK